jgi:1-acyl-sn-glycerol-3-phosphate acyltransferase
MTTGFFSYGGWFAVNVMLALLFPLFLAMDAFHLRSAIRVICVALMRVFFLRYLPLVGMYRLEKTDDIRKLSQVKRCLLVANHVSWLDAIILLTLIPNVQILVSSRYGRVPLVSRAMTWLGCIFVDREDRESVVKAVGKLRTVLDTGGTAAVFPEGTRARQGELKPFHDVFFALAKDAAVEVVPVILYLDTPFLGPRAENFLTQRCAVLHIRVLDPIAPNTREKGGDLSFRIRKQMRRMIETLDGKIS